MYMLSPNVYSPNKDFFLSHDNKNRPKKKTVILRLNIQFS